MNEQELLYGCAIIGAQTIDAFDAVEVGDLLTISISDGSEYKTYLRIL